MRLSGYVLPLGNTDMACSHASFCHCEEQRDDAISRFKALKARLFRRKKRSSQ